MQSTTKQQVALIILDGWGYREETQDNAIAAANTPYFKKLWSQFPHSLLEASGESVGLPKGQIGNSEIGHMTIGTGTILDTDLVRISKSAHKNGFIKNEAFNKLFNHVEKNKSTLHIIGLVSKGGVHSHQDHLHYFLKAAKEKGTKKIVIHAITDGRDTPPQSSAENMEELEKLLIDLNIGKIATLSGRSRAMDRDNNWDRTKKVEDAIFEGKGIKEIGKKPSIVLQELYKKGEIDEHLEPIIFNENESIQSNDAILFFNFRSDRTRQLSKKILERVKQQNLCFVTMTEYDKKFDCAVAFPPLSIETTLAAEISAAGLKQAHIAETEKFPHATYFLNGGREQPHENEKQIMLESHKVATHDLAPKMRAESIADKAIEQIEQGTDFIFINFANPDMVGHTANVPAIIIALEEVDKQLKRVIEALNKKQGIALITADHGNAEVNVDQITKEKHTAHTSNPVPLIVTREDIKLKNGGLVDLAPTVLNLFKIPIPPTMTGKALTT